MSLLLLAALVAALGVALFGLRARRRELLEIRERLDERLDARVRGSADARLQVPHIDASRCIGCGTCVRACPEEGVLDVIHGQAVGVHGARCVGHGLCAQECPVGAIAVTLGDLSERRDVPALDEHFGAPAVPGLYLAGEVTGFALVRTAIEHGAAVARSAAERSKLRRGDDSNHSAQTVLDLCIVGAGPAGISCALEAKRLGLSFVMFEREELGGTVAKYPRRKLVMTQPVELPLHGKLNRTSFEREELLELWTQLVEQHELPLRTSAELVDVRQLEDGLLELDFQGMEPVRATSACLALGRRGKPRKLGVPGEDLAKVVYGLVDARTFVGRRILVVGGGDSAVEAAMGLGEQEGNEVTLSYRGKSFTRIKARNERRLERSVAEGRVRVVCESVVQSIEPDVVHLRVAGESAPRTLANDDVFVLAGGIPPFELLQRAGISFDPADRPRSAPLVEQGTGLVRALGIAFFVSLLALGLAWAARDYYGMPRVERVEHEAHAVLGPGRGLGLVLGMGAVLAMLANVLYLLRRSPRLPLRFGSLSTWMTIHVATGIGALLLAWLHAGLVPGDTNGGHALLGLFVLVGTGVVGRYLYSFVPRAANGRELAIDEVREHLASISQAWDAQPAFAERVRERVDALAGERWRTSLPRRLAALIGGQARRARVLRELREEGEALGVSRDDLDRVMQLAADAHRSALSAAHFEDLRALMAGWRWLHRWAALFVFLVVALHVRTALRYASIDASWLGRFLP